LIKVMVLAQNLGRLAHRWTPVVGVEALQRLNRIALRMIATAALASAIGGCSSDLGLNNLSLVPKPETLMRKPDWATFSGGKNEFELRPVTAGDLVGPEGQCGSGPEQAAGFADPTGAGAAPPAVAGGISLQMTECDVVRRAGAVEKVDFGANDRGERVTTLTYTRGPLPGVYRFAGGRLVSIERAPGPPPAPAKPPKASAKKPAGT
jgi:hypothetical protein